VGHVFGRLIAFDLDGTIVDSSRDLADSVNDVLAGYGAAPLSHAAITRMVGDGARVLVGRALAAAGLPDRPDAITRFLDVYDTRLLNHTRLYDGMADVVRAARAHARVALITNKPGHLSERLLAGLGIDDLFDDVVAGDGPFPRKPDPAALMALIARAGATPSRALLIGDSRIDYETARRASARCCLVEYGFSGAAFEDVTADEAWVVADVAGVAGAIAQFVAAG
jgi:phosphoglycolate phosphatase